MTITYHYEKELKSDSIRELFLSVNWPVGNEPDKLLRAFKESDKVITARDNNKLVGLINTISDGALTVYIPYLLVAPEYQKQGIGRKLLGMIVSEYERCERIVLLTEQDTVDFYRKCGFLDAENIHAMMLTHQ